jgi:hypothetical protein
LLFLMIYFPFLKTEIPFISPLLQSQTSITLMHKRNYRYVYLQSSFDN